MWHKLPNVHRVKAKGKFYYYHRPTKTKLPGEPGSTEFSRALDKLNRGELPRRGHNGGPVLPPEKGSLADLILLYKASADYEALSPRSRTDYDHYMAILQDGYGDLMVDTIDREAINAIRDVYRPTPRKANYVIQVLSVLLSFAVDRPSRFHLAVNPALRSKKLKAKKGKGANRQWDDDEIAWFRGLCPPSLMTPFMLGLYTGQREADVLKMTWHDYRDGMIRVKQNKGGDEADELWIPCHTDLRAYLDELPRRAVQFCVGQRGQPYTIDGFKTVFFRALPLYGLAGLTFHGLRHTAAGKLAEAGCSDAEIMAITGHRTQSMVVRYRRGAAQKKIARRAMARLEQEQNAATTVKLTDKGV